MITAKHHAILFETMAYYSHAAMRAGGRKRLDCTFEAIERVGFV